MRPNDGLPPSCSLRKTAWPSSPTVRTASGPPPWIEVRSAPAARMNGLPVTARASIVSSASAASMEALSSRSEAGPKVLGLVWSSPLSRVIRPMVAPGRETLRSGALVTRSASETMASGTAQQVAHVGAHAVSPFESVGSAPVQCGFSQITVPPMPMPMHMVVRP